MIKYVGAIDQGTTSARFMIFDHSGSVVGMRQLEHTQIYPQAGWVEHDPLEIWARIQEVGRCALERTGVKAEDLAAIGVTNQRETTMVWNLKTGQPYANAIVWQDTRTAKICSELAKDGGQDRFRPQVGLPLATYSLGPKIKWILDNVPGVAAAAGRGEAIFGNMDTWAIWNLTGGLSGGEAKNTYGTGCFMLLNTGTLAMPSKHGLLTTLAYKLGNGPAVYALEGSIAITGALVQWLRDNLDFFSTSRSTSRTMPARYPTAAASTSYPHFQGCLPPTGNPMRAARSWA